MKSTLASLLCYPAHRLRLVESWWVGCAMSSAARISFMPVTEKNLEVFKVINENVLPVTYAEKFYLDLLKQPADMTKFGVLNDVFVGCIGCRLEPREDGKQDLYVMTLSVLAPYRRLGIGKKLLQSVLDSLGKHPNIARVYLHVWVSNPTALAFYDKFAFTNCGIVPDYYKKITPPDAVLLEKIVAPPAAATAAAVVMKP